MKEWYKTVHSVGYFYYVLHSCLINIHKQGVNLFIVGLKKKCNAETFSSLIVI
jgi:hypothetical protein